MIELFNIPNHKIDTSKFSHLLHGNIVQEFEKNFAEYVGAKYACSANSASSLIYLALKSFSPTAVSLPSTIPVVVPNMVVNA
jgi:dTDP-4-amino-4,6-dideoxygalactose transaminase